jgi:S1-C subfamily serine protease
MDEITVEGVAGEIVRAKLISSDAAADVSLLQLERVTAAMQVARIGDSDTVRVGPSAGLPLQVAAAMISSSAGRGACYTRIGPPTSSAASCSA